MAACVAVRDRLWTELPMKVELAASSVFSESRLRAWSMANSPDTLFARPQGGSMGSPPFPPADSERMQLRLRTGSSLGMPVSPYFPVMGPTVEEKCSKEFSYMLEQRYRFRTGSSVGMPISPWGASDGMGAQALSGPGLELSSALPLPPFPPDASTLRVGDSVTAVAPPRDDQQPRKMNNKQSKEFIHGQQLFLSSLVGAPAPSARFPSKSQSAPADPNKQRTTVMLRDLPEGFTRGALLDFLDSQGFFGRYDFAYLPVSFETLKGLNHAFVNMVSSSDADSLRAQLEGFSDWAVPNGSVCHVAWNDKHQGLASLVERYRNSPVMHNGIPEECKPIILSGGRRMQFPSSTQRINAPKTCKSKA